MAGSELRTVAVVTLLLLCCLAVAEPAAGTLNCSGNGLLAHQADPLMLCDCQYTSVAYAAQERVVCITSLFAY